MKDFDLRKYLSENPLLEDTSTSEDFLGLLMEITIENYCEENNILRENLNENFLKKLKSKFSKIPSKVKSKIKDTIDDVKSKTKDTKEFFKDITSIPKDLDPQKLLRTIQILKTKKNLNEEDLGEFTSIEQIKSLKPGDTFTWKGEKIEDFTANDMPVYNDDAGKEDGILKPNVIYVVSTPDSFEDGNGDLIRMPGFIGSKEYFEEVEESKEGMWARKMFDKYPWTEKLLRVLFASIGIGSVALGVADIEKLAGDDENVSKGGEAGTAQDPYADFLQDGDGSALTDTDDVQTGNVKIIRTDAANSTFDSIVDQVEQALDDANVNIGDTNLDNTDTNSAAVQTYDVGEYELSDSQKSEIVKDLVGNGLEDLNKKLEDLKGKNVTSFDFNIDYGGTVSNQADGDSNQANDGNDLIDGRISTAEEISKLVGEQITKIIKNALGDNVEVNINYNKVDTHNSVSNQTVQDAVDNMGTQSSFETVSIGDIVAEDVPPTETPNDIPNLIYNFLYTRYKPDDGKRLTAKDSPSSKTDSKSTTSTSPKEKGVDIAKTDNFDNMNRHNQIAVILHQINPSLNIYDKLKSEGIKSELTGQLDDILKNEKASNELKKLAKLIVTIRKSPNAFLKKVAKATGVEFSIRAKAKMTGFGKKGKSAAKLGLTETVLQSLKEGIIDDMIKDEDITAKKIDIIALLGSMYKSNSQKDGKRLSVLDQSKLSDEDKSKLKGIGFSTDEKSGKYMFMDDDEYKEFEKNKEKTKTTSTSKSTDDEFVNDPKLFAIEDRMEKLKALQIDFKQLDQTQEIDPFILGILSFVNPKFENDKNLLKRVLQKALKQIKDNNREQKQNIANQLKSESNIKQVNEDVTKTNKQVQKAIQTIANDSQLPRRINALTKFDDIVDLLVKIFFDQDDPDTQFFPGTSFSELEQGFLRAIRALDNDKDIQSSFDKSKTKGKEDEDKGLDVFTKTYLSKKDVASQITTEQIKSLIKNIITEGLTPSQTAKVKDKYKQIYSGMLKGDKKKLLKYIDPKFGRPNPDGMATGRAINLVKKEKDENVEESKTEKQRKWACAQVDSKSRPKGLSKAQAKEMCSDTNLSKNESMENTRLTELIKTALKGPVKEGYYGTSDIENVTESLGYDDLNHFFNDNPGAVEALTSWIENIPEFRKSLENDFSNQELEELGFYNLDGYDTDDDDDIEESFPDLTGDGKITKADILKGRGVELKERIFKELRK
tara:strand:+ start:2868 stop:6536 length:3669 start_codon:yes stop_codon:yes gene_type:complete